MTEKKFVRRSTDLHADDAPGTLAPCTVPPAQSVTRPKMIAATATTFCPAEWLGFPSIMVATSPRESCAWPVFECATFTRV